MGLVLACVVGIYRDFCEFKVDYQHPYMLYPLSCYVTDCNKYVLLARILNVCVVFNGHYSK